MLTLHGTVRSAVTFPARVDRKTGEALPARHMVQIESTDGRGLVNLVNLVVPNLDDFAAKVGEPVDVPVRAWVSGQKVSYGFDQ